MKKIVLSLFLSSQIVICPPEGEEQGEQSAPLAQYNPFENFQRNMPKRNMPKSKGMLGIQKSDEELEEQLQLKQEDERDQDKQRKIMQRDRKSLAENWDADIEKAQRENELERQKSSKAKKTVKFSEPVPVEHDPVDWDTFYKKGVLDSAKVKRLGHLTMRDLSSEEFSKLLQHNDILNLLSKTQIQTINPRVLSKALYSESSNPLTEDFVKKLSEEQIITLLKDHVAWGFHNWGTSFKKNFTPDALAYMNEVKEEAEYQRVAELVGLKK
jgi:hypothetical protein